MENAKAVAVDDEKAVLVLHSLEQLALKESASSHVDDKQLFHFLQV